MEPWAARMSDLSLPTDSVRSPTLPIRVMVVEDELLIAMLIEDTLTDRGYVVVGPFSNLPDALHAARTQPMDAALLDVNLRGERVYPVAEALEARGIPFLLLSGYGVDAVPANRAHWSTCSKPFMPGDLAKQLKGLIA